MNKIRIVTSEEGLERTAMEEYSQGEETFGIKCFDFNVHMQEYRILKVYACLAKKINEDLIYFRFNFDWDEYHKVYVGNAYEFLKSLSDEGKLIRVAEGEMLNYLY